MTIDTASLSAALPALGSELERRARVLLVDDQAANVHALYQVFASDHQVFMATNGEQALRLCSEKLPDLVLLDVEMPGMDGHEVCRRLKADPQLRDIPVIFVTGHDGEEAESAGLDLGAVDFISKPINPRIVRARAKTHITLKRQTDLLRAGVYLDGLTGTPNRRAFDERLQTEWMRSQRDGSPLGLVMIDVDQFKRFNDHGGHHAGDDCLRQVAMHLKSSLKRPGDLLARYGGEEFACILPGTNTAGAMVVGQMLVDTMRSAGLPHPASDVGPVVTISAGAASARALPGTMPATLVEAADACLYQAKLRGRDRVVGLEEGTGQPAPGGVTA